MTDQNEEVLRRSLDAVDRHRNRVIIGFIVTVAFVLAALLNGTYAARTGNVNVFTHAVMIAVGVGGHFRRSVQVKMSGLRGVHAPRNDRRTVSRPWPCGFSRSPWKSRG